MKKIILTFLSLILISNLFLIGAYASNFEDGIYEVPIILIHSEKEKESFGNKFLLPTGVLKVENRTKTMTIILSSKMSGIEFSYYVNGLLDSDVQLANATGGVTVQGESYDQGFEIPIMADGDVRLKFSVPVMPMSPSARLRIDYESAKQISASREELTKQEKTSDVSTTNTRKNIETTVQTTNQTTSVVSTATVVQTQPTTFTASVVTGAETQSTGSEINKTDKLKTFLLIIAATFGLVVLVYPALRRKQNDK